MQELTLTSAQATRDLGAAISKILLPGMSLELVGDVGAGKTTLVKGLVAGYGVDEEVQSPSFTISRVYELPGDVRLYHYDFYRLTDAGILRDELTEVREDPTAIIVIEWAEIVEDVLKDDRLRLTIRATGENERHVTIYGADERLAV